MAQGGIVPPGYPNDSYPARLTSLEAVIPLNKLSQLVPVNSLSGTVVFKVEGRDLVGVLNNNDKFTRN
jgi:hypothetical protein